GMVDSPPERRIDDDDHLEQRDGVAIRGGEARFRHLYCQRGAVDDVVATWTEHLGERAEVMTRETAIGRGWFGAVEPLVRPRLGDVIVACRSDHAVLSSVDFPYETTLVGLHGSLTEDEMLIPLVVD
ncbi:MAG: alkaline phosphatase family protein, partial [Nocardioides sp.]|nr:alkaline phosphatase family protein [Nocardioides sp.]